MTRLAVTLVALALVTAPLQGQLQVPSSISSGQSLLSTRASDFAADLTVPQSPAFLLLGDEPSVVLRPSTTRELVTNVSSLIDDSGDLAIPEGFGLEFSPVLLLGGAGLTIQSFEDQQLLERIRFSFAATRQGANGGVSPRRFSAGVRWGLQDRSDLRTNAAFVDTVTAIATTVNEIYAAARRRAGNPGIAPDPVPLTVEEQDRIRALSDSVRIAWETYGWNEPVLDVAGAVRLSASGPAGDSIRVDRWAVWAMKGRPLTNNGQLLYGVSAGGDRDPATNEFRNHLHLTGRVYIGSNQAKVFGEVQLRLEEEDGDDAYLVNGGGELRLIGGGWIALSAGVLRDRETGTATVVTALDFRLGVPGF